MSVTIGFAKDDIYYDINMSNMNFYRVVIRTLERCFPNIEWAYCGGLTPEETKTYVHYLSNLIIGNNVLWLTAPDEKYKNWLICGIDEEYVRDRISQLMVICSRAVSNNTNVEWG